MISLKSSAYMIPLILTLTLMATASAANQSGGIRSTTTMTTILFTVECPGCYSPSLGAYDPVCPSIGQNGTVQCSGFIYRPYYGDCTRLAIPYMNPNFLVTTAYVYYTLRNLPVTTPASGSWLSVTGQLHEVYSMGSNVAGACSGTYLQVTSIS